MRHHPLFGRTALIVMSPRHEAPTGHSTQSCIIRSSEESSKYWRVGWQSWLVFHGTVSERRERERRKGENEVSNRVIKCNKRENSPQAVPWSFERKPGSQRLHLISPLVSLKVSLTHGTQVPVVMPYFPMSQSLHTVALLT